MDYKLLFKNKKITVMGLGLLGRGIGYTKFLAQCGAQLVVTDLKNKEQLRTSLKQLAGYKNITYVLGEHRLEDFRHRDMIIKAAGVPLDSVYIAEAIKHNIPVEMDVSLFAKCAPFVTIVGITGTRGKSMTTAIIYDLLKHGLKDKNIYLGGNVRGHATLPLLKKVKSGNILVAELDSWQLQGFGDAKISPSVSVFTTFMPDHMNYYKGNLDNYFADKANIFRFQKENDVLVIGETMQKLINKKEVKGKLVVAKSKDVANYKFLPPGEHNRANLACAVEVVKALGVPESKIKKTVAKFKGVEGRLQLLRVYKGIKIYNDNNATTPEATIAGIQAVAGKSKKNIVLICGGNDKNITIDNLVKIA
ncbi:MAG: UDP-N-acetylmuramoyl-L-alanine--D-glutamate ligase, partial [Candidatus Paceibacterota bacterium]